MTTMSSMIPEETSFHENAEDMRRPGEGIVLDDDDDDDYDDIAEEEDDAFDPLASSSASLSLKTKSKKHRKSSVAPSGGGVPASSTKRRRRRSSARFLRLGDEAEGEDSQGSNTGSATSLDNLGEVYQKAIRMNAENRINAANSWNLNLIDHLDRFVAPELRTKTSLTMEDTLSAATGVNFTKASCTLDASVKIYSYRVDDVHLTSYKVLANLNRTDTNKEDGGKKNKKSKQKEDGNDDEPSQSNRKNSGGNTDTLEHNLSNINIHKLDAAFDIDPLFHKMSKTFDEGGAKGLLLANLGVSHQGNGTGGCKIVFDSTLDDDENSNDASDETDQEEGNDNAEPTTVDVTSLAMKLSSLVSASGQSIEDMPLVPQLASLRYEFSELEKDGFVDNQAVSTKRYAASHAEEVEADRSIHIEAIERSRASQAELGRSLMAQDESKTSLGTRNSLPSRQDYDEQDDFGGGGFDFAGDDDDFGDFHDGDHRFSSASFQAAPSFDAGRVSSGSGAATQTQKQHLMPQPSFSQATVLLDAIASGDITTSQSSNPYEYFNSQALANLSQGNLWAGADHWKKMTKPRKANKSASKNTKDDATASKTKTPAKKKKGRKGKKAASSSDRSALVDITKPIDNIDELLQKPKTTKKSATSKLQWTQAMQTKHSNEDNLLPSDAGLEVKELTKLFLRPNANLVDMMKEASQGKTGTATPKVVGFGGVETWGGDDYDDDDGGFGFDFGGDDENEPEDFVVPDLEGVRKVEKIKVGYATVAKKVDVKRLKRDLWVELERTFQHREELKEDPIPTSDADPLENEITAENLDHDDQEEATPISFQDTVRDMQESQSQTDVTLPFYFICVLHLCNEKGMTLESSGLSDFLIHSAA